MHNNPARHNNQALNKIIFVRDYGYVIYGFGRIGKMHSSSRTYMAKPGEVEKKWYVIDAAGKPLGRVATRVAHILRGKHKPTFTPHVDVGDYVIVVNADQVVLTGRKAFQKMYYRHSGYPGGLKAVSFETMMARHPERVMQIAVRGMIPHNRLGRAVMKKLKVYRGSKHPHGAQNPVPWEEPRSDEKED